MQENREGVEKSCSSSSSCLARLVCLAEGRSSVASRSAGRVAFSLKVFWQQGLKSEAALSRGKSQAPADFPGHRRNSKPRADRVSCCSRRWGWHLGVGERYALSDPDQ